MICKRTESEADMTRAPAGRRHTGTPTEAPVDSLKLSADSVLTDDDMWRFGTAAAAALDQIDRPTVAEGEYDRHLNLLTELEKEARSGRVPKEELLARRAAALDHLRDSVG